MGMQELCHKVGFAERKALFQLLFSLNPFRSIVLDINKPFAQQMRGR